MDKAYKTGIPPLSIGFRISLLLILVHTMLFQVVQAAPETRVVRVGAYSNSPKIHFDEQGEVAGFWPDLMAQIAAAENWEVRYVTGSWQQGLDRLADAEIDVMPDVAFTEARARRFTFSETTVLMSWSRLYVHQDNQSFHSVRDLDGLRIAALKGSVNLEGPSGLREMVQSFNLSVTFLELDDYDAVFAAVESGLADAGISNRNFANLNAGRYAIKKTPLIFQPANLKFAFPRHSDSTGYLMSRIDDRLDRWQKDSSSIYYQLLAKYFEAEVAEREVEVWPFWLARSLQVAGFLLLTAGLVITISRLQVRRKTRELNQRNDELKVGEQRYREIFNSPSDAIFVHDAATGRVLDVNRAVLDMYGLTYDEAMAIEPGRLTSGQAPYTPDRIPALIKAAIEQGPQVFDWQARKMSGELFWVEISLRFTEITGEGRVIAVVRDITDRMRMEEESLKIKKLESVGVLAGGIAHDFNNILSAVLGNLELAREEMAPGHSAAPLLGAAEDAVKRAAKLTKQLLTFSRGGSPVKEASSLPEIIRESADFVISGSSVACNFECPADLWLINSDSGQISQVIQNLALNARHAMPGGGVVEISCTNLPAAEIDPLLGLVPGNYVMITISDTGVGIPRNIVDKIFDPYFTTKQEGSGLGLAITHSIIDKHGGRIGVSSEPGQGTCFTIHLPAATNSVLAKKEPASVAPSTRSGRVLVMDDDQGVRDTTGRMLTKLGFAVDTANDGKQALVLFEQALATKHPFDLVILDLTIPGGMGGQETARLMLDLAPNSKILVASGYSNDEVMANFEDNGFAGTLAKPITMENLARLTDQVFADQSLKDFRQP